MKYLFYLFSILFFTGCTFYSPNKFSFQKQNKGNIDSIWFVSNIQATKISDLTDILAVKNMLTGKRILNPQSIVKIPGWAGTIKVYNGNSVQSYEIHGKLFITDDKRYYTAPINLSTEIDSIINKSNL